ncbi:hypothetical protein [Prochlorococcus sp. MIT 1307]|uniref:hypothetical protein n=1 Tax=Prochlorococcus sp. MIT 1307 TaxID=3096219 RepID=UPI002A760A19|nr:hypothetical protein [Prochlorococcus sp. MIT 1307]
MIYSHNLSVDEEPIYNEIPFHEINTPGVDLAFCGFQIIKAELNYLGYLKVLKCFGFDIPDTEFTHITSAVYTYKYLWKKSMIFDSHPTDGLVVKTNSEKLQKQLGDSFNSPKWMYVINSIISGYLYAIFICFVG